MKSGLMSQIEMRGDAGEWISIMSPFYGRATNGGTGAGRIPRKDATCAGVRKLSATRITVTKIEITTQSLGGLSGFFFFIPAPKVPPRLL
jgi:hypothetical protein